MQSGLHGRFFHPEDFCDVGNGKLHDFLENEREPKLLRECCDGILERNPALAFLEKLEGPIAGCWNVDDCALTRRQQFLQGFQLPRLAGPSAVTALTSPSGDAIQPRRRIGAAFELIPLPKRQQKGLLDEILGVVIVTAETKSK